SHLVDDELSVGAIAERVDLSQSALSQHLAKLRSLGLVQTRRGRQMIYYSFRSDEVRRLLELLVDVFGVEQQESIDEGLRRTGTGPQRPAAADGYEPCNSFPSTILPTHALPPIVTYASAISLAARGVSSPKARL